MKESSVELILWDWLITKGINVKQLYFNRKNKLNAPTFNTSGINEKPDFIISFDRGFGIEYLAIEIKTTSSSKDIHDSGKILRYYKNYLLKKTKYYIEGQEVQIKHFAVMTNNSINGKLFGDDETLISNTKSSDNWRRTNAELNLIPEYEYQRTSDYLRRLWAEWRVLRKELKFIEASSIGIIISNPNKDNLPYFFSMVYTSWLENKSWKQRFWRL